MPSLARHIVQNYQKVSLLQEREGVGTWLGVNARASHLIKICRGAAPRFQQEFDFLSNTSQKHFPKALKHSFQEGEEIYVREYITGQPLGLFFWRGHPGAIGEMAIADQPCLGRHPLPGNGSRGYQWK